MRPNYPVDQLAGTGIQRVRRKDGKGEKKMETTV